MDVDAAVSRAQAAAARGDLHAAVEGLRAAIEHDPTAEVPRLALASLYRASGHPDQAGRWGIQTDGWTTDAERHAFQRSLRVLSGSAERVLVHQLRLGSARELSGDAVSILWDRSAALRSARSVALRRGLLTLGPVLVQSAGCVLVGGLVVLGVIVLPGTDANAAIARWTMFAALLCLLGAVGVRLTIAIDRRRFRPIVMATAGFCLVLAAVVGFVTFFPPPLP